MTLELPNEQRMIPYSSFETAQCKEGRSITILFAEWLIQIRGQNLEELWEKLQMFDLSIIRISEASEDGGCSISHLELIVREDD